VLPTQVTPTGGSTAEADLDAVRVAGDLLVGLDEAQRRAVTSRAQPLAILAPAGSGKTRVLTRRIAWRVATGDADASHVLALTFTRKAAAELRDRLRALGLRDGIATGTIHGVAWAQLRARWADDGRTPPALLVRKGRLLGDVLRGATLTIPQLAGEIEWAKARLVGPAAYVDAVASHHRRPPGPPERIAELYERYEDEKRRRRLVDFDDLLKLCAHLLLTDTAFAATQRWRFRHLFVDEFQDVNPLQMHLLDAWRGDRWDLCVVGDPHQAIYGWNGADAGFLAGFQRHYPPAEIVELDVSYRSTPQILDAAAEVLTTAKLGERSVRAVRADGDPPRLERYPSDREEALAIARAARDRRAPHTPWSSQAVLTRTNAQLPLIAEALRLAGVPHRVRGGDELLRRPEIRAALDVLRRADRALASALPDLAALATEQDDDEARANVELVERCAHDQMRLDGSATSGGFVAWLIATLESEGDDGTGNAVTLATFHAAKGLEWPVVHLAGLEDGFVPITHARTRAAREEEARLLYVAMTRAEDELRCTWAARRTFGDRSVERRLSPWLTGLAERQQARRSAGSGPPDDWRLRLADQRRTLAAAVASVRTAPPATLAALQAWRDTAARAARVEPEALVDDRLLEAIAARRPATTDELAAVPGMGRLLAVRLGDGLLAAVAGAPTA
jgi:DNA helicase-2/ATP-dependent DNA helicase PcrA